MSDKISTFHELELDAQTLRYTLLRSRRRSLALSIEANAELIVRAPLAMSKKAITSFIREKEQWIIKKQGEAKASLAQHSPLELIDGEQLLYFGMRHTIKRASLESPMIDDLTIHIPLTMELKDFAEWLGAKLYPVIKARIAYYAALLDVGYASVKLSNAQSRWGSCGVKNSLNFSWRLVMCPLWVIDYVVVHELSHVPYKNHGREFWAHVACAYPKHKEARTWLRENRALLNLF